MTEDVTKQQQTSGNDNDENHENEMSSVEEEQEDKSQKTEQSSSQDSSSSPRNDNHEQTAPQTRFNFYTAQVAEEIRRETSQDSIGANSEKSTPPLSKKPNRFHFYNAAEVGPVQVISSINTKNNYKRTSSQPSPTMATESSVEVTSLRSPSLPREISSSQQKEVDSNEILRSLQETERQQHPRRSSLIAARKQCTPTPRSNKTTTTTTNPYETAIKEALQMLQSNSVGTPDNIPPQPQDEDDVVMQMRKTETSPSTTKKERAWRKERIAKYASRFDEMNTSGNEQAEGGVEQALPTSGHNTKMATSWTPPTPGEAYNNPNAEALYRLRSESDDVEATPQSVDMQPLLDTSLEQEATDVTSVHSTNSQVQKGVEQVLLAILERANSSTTDKQQQQTVNTKNELDALTHAMENLLQPSLSFETVSTVRSRRPNRRESEQQALDDLQSTTTTTTRVESSCQVPVRKASVVEELLQDSFRNNKVPDETKDSSFEEEHTDFVESSSSTELLVDESQQSIEVVESSDVFDEEREDTSGSTSSSYPDEEEDAFEEEELETRTHDAVNTSVDESTLTHLLGKLRRMSDADREEGEDSEDDKNVLEDESVLTNVLGPLSHRAGGTTGVVLETASYEEEPPPPPDGEDDDSAPLSPASIYETLSSAVKDAESFMSYISGGYPAVKDKYSTCDEEEATMVRGPPPDGSSGDHVTDAHELMRSLCAHLLPYGVDKSAESPKLERIPMWDESNPDEAGYRIIRLSKRQLRAVELEFDNMVKSVKQTSERDLNGSLSKTDANEDWNGVPDDVFARDLEEAEELLDQEEKRQDEADRAKARADPEESDEDESDEATSSSGSGSSESGTMETTRSPLLSDDDDTLLTSHPDFPGVKTTGRGEIGDLEYFHLPIIYKSHVTGFEPTKDLFLEPGNVVAGQYLVENELGSAAFSTAYRCIDLSSEMKTTEKGEVRSFDFCVILLHALKCRHSHNLCRIPKGGSRRSLSQGDQEYQGLFRSIFGRNQDSRALASDWQVSRESRSRDEDVLLSP